MGLDTWTGRQLGEPTAEQWQALQSYAAKHGRTWKQQLRDAWLQACIGMPDSEQPWLLQQVRNQFGPRWLSLVDISKER